VGKLDGDKVRVGDTLDDNRVWFYRVVEIRPHFWDGGGTGFLLQKVNRWGSGDTPFWVTREELETMYTPRKH
jgi:hypothetical protein